MALNPDRVDFYEVKGPNSKNSLRKAVDQLRRMREYWKFSGDDFVYTPENGIERLEDIVREIKLRKYKRH